MVTFRNNNNNRRSHFRNNNNRRSHFRRNDDNSSFSNNDKFQRKSLGSNNHNVAKLIEKYNDLAREALANEDKILSESYFQFADHFTRVQTEQENNRISKIEAKQNEVVTPIKLEESTDTTKESENKKLEKSEEKKSATS